MPLKANIFVVSISGVTRGKSGKLPPQNPENFVKDEKQPRPQSALIIDSSKNYNFRLIFPNVY